MLPHRDYTRRRLARLEQRLAALVYVERAPVDSLMLSPAVGRVDHAEAQALEYREVSLGEQLGPLFSTHWLRVSASVPGGWAGSRVDLLLDTRSEATLWVGGRAVQGINSSGTQPRPEATVREIAGGGETVDLEVEIACNDPFGAHWDDPVRGPFRTMSPFVLDGCELARFDRDAWRLLWDFKVLRELELEDGVDPSFAGELVAGLNEVCNAWGAGDQARCRERLAEDSDALVLRLYEAYGGRGTARIELAMPFTTARHSNLLEDELRGAEVQGGAVVLDYRPWEIVTLLVS